MSERTYTERELALAQRSAFIAGAQSEYRAWQDFLKVTHSPGFDAIAASRQLYPLPKVTRPRVHHAQNGNQYRVVDGQIETLNYDRQWVKSETYNPCDMRAFDDLLANPNEEVED